MGKTAPRGTKEQRDAALALLRTLLKPGQEVFTVLRHVSKSGMSRHISVFCVGADRRPRDISHAVGRAADYLWDMDDGGLHVNGCGMDMGFEVVYNLGAALWPKGTPKPHGTRNGKPDSTGGYALQHRWL